MAVKKLLSFFIILCLLFTILIFNVSEATPLYSNLTASPTKAGSLCFFNSTWSGATSLTPDGGYIFSTNNTGVWANDTWTSFISSPATISVSKTLNSTVGKIIGFQWFANNSLNEWNSTSIQSFTSTFYLVSSMTTLVGTVANGTITDLNDNDTDIMRIDEFDSDTNAIDLRFNFTNMPAIPYSAQINLRQRYVGLPSHHINIYAYNYTSSNWVQYGIVDNSASYYWINMTLTGNLTDLVRNGNFTIRMLHPQHGESTHRFYIDTLIMSVAGDYGPSFNNIGRTSNYAGQPTTFHAYVSDEDPDLSHWIFSTNNSGTWVNETFAFASGYGGWANITKTLNSSVSYLFVVQYYFWANCTDGNVGVTSTRQITPQDGSAPTYSAIIADNLIANTEVILDCNLTDNIANHYYIFSWNNTGVWTNDTAKQPNPTSSPEALASFTGTWRSDGVVSTIIYSNDTSNNWGLSDQNNFVLTVLGNNFAPPNPTSTPIPFITPSASPIISIPKNMTLFFVMLVVIGIIIVVVLGSDNKKKT